MNKVVLVLCLILLLVCGANTYLLYQLVSGLQHAGEKIQSATKELEKVQPVLNELKDKVATMAPGKPPLGPGDAKGKPGEPGDSTTPDAKLPPNKPPLLPGPLPK